MPNRATGPGSRLMRNKAAPSPMLIPSRFLLDGLHKPWDRDSSAPKPFSVRPHRVSTPPTTTASQSPAAMSRRAEENALALEVQAVDTVQAGPLSLSARRRYSLGLLISCCK